jgi:hypothetical protein
MAFDIATRPRQMPARLSAEIGFAISEIDTTICGCNRERRSDKPQPRASTKEIP